MQTYQSLLTENFLGFATMILIHKVNQYFGKQVPISASLRMVIVKTMNFPNRDQVDQLKKWPVAMIIWPIASSVAREWALGKWFRSLRSQYYILYILYFASYIIQMYIILENSSHHCGHNKRWGASLHTQRRSIGSYMQSQTHYLQWVISNSTTSTSHR